MVREKLKVKIMISYLNSPVDIIQLYFLITYIIFQMYCCIILEIY